METTMTIHQPRLHTPSPISAIPRPNRYHLGDPFAKRLLNASMDQKARRLAYLLAYATARRTSEWHGAVVPQPHEGHAAPFAELIAAAGLSASNCNRPVTDGIAGLAAAGLLERLDLECSNRDWLHWRWNDDVHDALFNSERWGSCDVAWLRICRTPLDYLLHGCAFHGRWASIPRHRGQPFHASGSLAGGCRGSGSTGRVRRFQFGRALAHALAGKGPPVSVVDEAAQARIGQGRIADGLVPVLYRKVAGDDRGAAAVAVFEDFQQVAPFG